MPQANIHCLHYWNKEFQGKTHFLIYSRTNIAEKKSGLSDICALKSQTCFGIYDPFKSFFFFLWTCKSMNLGDLQAHLCITKVFQVFVWICVCELYCWNSLANIAFQPVMYRLLVVCRNKLFVHESIIKQNKPIVSRLHSVGVCIFHWKDQEVLYGNFFICLCKVGKETCDKMCASRLLLHCW